MLRRFPFLFLCFCVLTLVSQKNHLFYFERPGPGIKKEKLNEVQTLSELSPQLWWKLRISGKDREELDRRKRIYFPEGFYIYPEDFNYDSVIDYVSVTISAICGGKECSATGSDDHLTAGQKKILFDAGMGANVEINIGFKYKKLASFDTGTAMRTVYARIGLKVLPAQEAEFPGGETRFKNYLEAELGSILSQKGNNLLPNVNFIVDESGRISAVKIIRSSGSRDTDNKFLQTFIKMPKWKPAENAKGQKVKQEFTIPFSNEREGC